MRRAVDLTGNNGDSGFPGFPDLPDTVRIRLPRLPWLPRRLPRGGLLAGQKDRVPGRADAQNGTRDHLSSVHPGTPVLTVQAGTAGCTRRGVVGQGRTG